MSNLRRQNNKFIQLTEHVPSVTLVDKYELKNRLSKNAKIKLCKTLHRPAAFMGVKLGLLHWGKNPDCEMFEKKVLREKIRSKREGETGYWKNNWIMNCFIINTPHQIWLGQWNKGSCNCGVCGTCGGQWKCLQGFDAKFWMKQTAYKDQDIDKGITQKQRTKGWNGKIWDKFFWLKRGNNKRPLSRRYWNFGLH
jgi:hypothetical protein